MAAAISPALYAQAGKTKKTAQKKAATAADVPNNKEIHWITSIPELEAKMQKEPKKVYMDVYTDWCGWCKKMDVSTFSNPEVIKYMNTNYYAVKLDAERKDTIRFQGKEFHFEPQMRSHTFAVDLMQGKMSYPTTIIMLENFQNPQPIPGYLDVNQMETILTFMGNNTYKHQAWAEYQKSYQPAWAKGVAADMSAPAGH